MRVLIAIALALLAVDALPALKPRSTKVERETLKIRAPTRKQIAARARKPQLKNKTPGNELDFITPIFGPQLIFSMGTPSQDFLGGEIDTTSGDSWIVDIRADQPEPAPWQFDPRNSSTVKISNYPYTADVVDVNGLPAKISGNLADEIFTVFNQKFQMRFPLIEQITPYLQTAEVPDVFATGRFGFGFHATDYVDLFLPKLFSHVNATQRTLTSVIFECMPADNVEESTSEFSIGYMDTTFCNASTTVKVPLTDGGHWNFYINSFTFLNMTSTTKQQAILNTRELLTGVPTNLYNYVYKTLNATVNPDYAWPIVDCNQNFPLLTVKSNGDTFPITSEQYIFKDFAVDETPCHLMLYPMNGGGFLPSWSFGYIWMYQKCITFDYGRRQLAFTDYNNGLCDQN